MLKYHDGIGVQTLVGGTRFKFDQKRLESDPCQVCQDVMPVYIVYHVKCSCLLRVFNEIFKH